MDFISNKQLERCCRSPQRVLTTEKLDKHLSGQVVNNTPLMKMGKATHPGKEVSINAQDSIREKIENLTSMMYKLSIQQEKGKKPFRPQVYPQRGRGKKKTKLWQ